MSDILVNRSLSPGNFFSTARKQIRLKGEKKSFKFNKPCRKNLSEQIIGKRTIKMTKKNDKQILSDHR